MDSRCEVLLVVFVAEPDATHLGLGTGLAVRGRRPGLLVARGDAQSLEHLFRATMVENLVQEGGTGVISRTPQRKYLGLRIGSRQGEEIR